MITFYYYTGIKAELFKNPRLLGSWDANGQYSDMWSEIPMIVTTGYDDCPAFTCEVNLVDNEVGWTFYWGIMFDTETQTNIWGIMTEVKNSNSQDRYRSFELKGDLNGKQVEEYYLNESRRLGAQKFYEQSRPSIRFAVWAPNAQSVDVVFSYIFDENDPLKSPIQNPIRKNNICGGYISDKGEGINPNMKVYSMLKGDTGIWITNVNDPYLQDFSKYDHSLYMYRIMKEGDTKYSYMTDLYSRCQIGYGNCRPKGIYTGKVSKLDGTIGCSVVIDPDAITEEFNESTFPESKWILQEEFWKDGNTFPIRPKNVNDLIIYELHLGALGFGNSIDKPGTIEDAIAFLPYLKELGINAIELLPMSEFGGGTGNWGYSTSHYFAIEYSGGGRDQFKWFIRECHKLGISIIVDVVYNHYSHNAERAEWLYDTYYHNNNCYYWYEGNPWDYHKFDSDVELAGQSERKGTGGYIDNVSTAWAPRYHEEQVRKMFISSAVALAIEFNIDGFRLDQTTSIHAYNKLHADGNVVDEANKFGKKFLREFTSTLKLIKPEIILMAEDHSNEPFVTNSSKDGGLGFDATWYADFYHHLIGDTDKGIDYAKLIKTAGTGRDKSLAMDYFGHALEVSGNKKIVYSESHDEAGNGNLTDRNIKISGSNRKYAEARCRLAFGLTIFSAGTPMFLFGEEVGAEKKFLYGNVVQNREDYIAFKNTSGKFLFEFYKQAIALRRTHSTLRCKNIEIVYTHNDNCILVFRRWDDNDEYLIIATLSNIHYNQPSYEIVSEKIYQAEWLEIFNSNAEVFGGDNVGNFSSQIYSQNRSLNCIIPGNSITVLQKLN